MLIRLKSGQSLLEAIIAIGVILVATISATTLIVTTISTGQISADKIQAANFAREGVEVVRGIRDSNWLKRSQNIADEVTTGTGTTVQWDDSGSSSDGYKLLNGNYLAVFTPNTGWVLTAVGVNTTVISSVSNSYDTQLCTVNCAATKFSRVIAIVPTADAPAGNYLNVTSSVTWNNHGDKTLSMTERLYDWR